ncbi:hypothetical protein [Rhodococcoides fascians]|uniref:hypothetical protein n=1 Tax=Rhodococcoides fascians TaxID=1828 RepID=UPI00050C369A|nr:hypothetical protein [Rhodococcus fascians]
MSASRVITVNGMDVTVAECPRRAGFGPRPVLAAVTDNGVRTVCNTNLFPNAVGRARDMAAAARKSSNSLRETYRAQWLALAQVIEELGVEACRTTS